MLIATLSLAISYMCVCVCCFLLFSQCTKLERLSWISRDCLVWLIDVSDKWYLSVTWATLWAWDTVADVSAALGSTCVDMHGAEGLMRSSTPLHFIPDSSTTIFLLFPTLHFWLSRTSQSIRIQYGSSHAPHCLSFLLHENTLHG